MKILAIDIGEKTQDILLYDNSIPIENRHRCRSRYFPMQLENSIKLVLPSPTMVFREEVIRSAEDLFIKGDTIGGGMLSRAIIEHAKKYKVFMTRQAACTIRDDISVVKSYGIEILDPGDVIDFESSFQGKIINLQEINLKLLKNFLMNFNEKLNVDYVAVAVQDHGAAPRGESDRKFRFKLFSNILKKSREIESFAFKNPPKHYLRMNSVMSAIKRQTNAKALIMDTSPDSVVGCLEDENVDSIGPSLIINMGNGHSIFMIISEGKIDALMEHHTRCLNDAEKLKNLVKKFADGNVTSNEIYNDYGNGALIINPCGFENLKQIVVTGPNRNLFKKTNLCAYYTAPAGDMMMTGPLGLIRCVKKIYGIID